MSNAARTGSAAGRCWPCRVRWPPPGRALDVGIFSPAGVQLGNQRGFRGWSGGFRDRFATSAAAATPGYLPGPIEPGRWHLILGPYTVAPQGLTYTVGVTLRFGCPDSTFVPNPAPASAPDRDRGRAWYRGDGHLHTVHSDGRRTPAELATAACVAGLDFIVSTEHNTRIIPSRESACRIMWYSPRGSPRAG